MYLVSVTPQCVCVNVMTGSGSGLTTTIDGQQRTTIDGATDAAVFPVT